MNNQAAPVFHNFHLMQHINVHMTVSRKIHFMQRIVQLFGPGALGQVLNSPYPVILPFILYKNSFDVHVTVSRKIHFMQRIVQLFGPSALGQVLNSPHPVILPFILYENSFDVHVFILL